MDTVSDRGSMLLGVWRATDAFFAQPNILIGRGGFGRGVGGAAELDQAGGCCGRLRYMYVALKRVPCSHQRQAKSRVTCS